MENGQNPQQPNPTNPQGQNPGGAAPAGGQPASQGGQAQAGQGPQGTQPAAGQTQADPGAQPEPTTEAPQVIKRDLSPFDTKVALPKHDLSLNDNYFIKMLAGSLSLTLDEKKRIIESVPTLSQYQVDKLIDIFEEEKVKFAELEQKHKEQVQKLRAKQADDWKMLEMDVDKVSKKNEDEQKADEIRKKLGL